MKGVVLAGGLGTRLWPLTKVTNKCLLPVYDRPMIYYAIQQLVDCGLEDIILVCGGNASGEFLRVLGNGKEFGLKRLHYTYQEEPKGIADALSLAQDFVGDDCMCVILSDNIFSENLREPVQSFAKNPKGAVIFGARVKNPQHYGVIEKNKNNEIIKIIEKPTNPKNNLIATGLYLYDNTIWDFIFNLKPSKRGELEITDVNNFYLSKKSIKIYETSKWWIDCGENIDGYLDACIKIRKIKNNDNIS